MSQHNMRLTVGKRVLLYVLFFFLGEGILLAQSRWDTSYVAEEPEMLVFRSYLSRKFTSLYFPSEDLRYQPNSGLNMGIGFTYQNFTLNLAFPPGFLNRNREADFPRFLDLQGHIYPRNWVIDFFGQFYKGYRIPDGIGDGAKYLRPDLDLLKVGLHANYIFKGDKISLPAAVHQSAIQKKSAISPLLGFEMYRVQVTGDSLILPAQLVPKSNYQSADFLHLGPNAGLIGTLVLGKGFFATGSFTGNLALGTAWNQDRQGGNGNWKLGWGYHARAYLGYNGPRFGMNGNYIHKNLILPTFGNLSQEVYTGNYRLVLVYKIHPAQKFASSFAKYNPSRIFRK
ncbi:MAG: DUF4421 family protein [Bacteroidetes bacterium]|nr:DUF4421 family protein [Bacteroidota bacterium]